MSQMQREERMRLIYDTQILREKVDERQLQLQRQSAELAELRAYKIKQDVQIEREAANYRTKVERKVELRLAQE